MHRREFLKALLMSGTAFSLGSRLFLGQMASAAGFPALSSHVLVNLMLYGGPDFRHLFPPAFDPDPESYGYNYWESRATSHAIPVSAAAFMERWENDYFSLADGSSEFGMLKSCGWLKDMWEAGNVAIICNAVGGRDRNHPHSQLQMDLGDLTAGQIDIGTSGWGGRLAVAAGRNVISLSRTPRRFCYGPNPADPGSLGRKNLIAMANSRKMSLYRPGPEYAVTNPRSVIARSLESYYAAKAGEMDPESVYYRFIEHEQTLREFGDQIDQRLAGIALPASIEALYQGALNYKYLGEQIRNLHDCFACSDFLNMGVASMEFGSWDSHKSQREMIEPMFEDLFGYGKAFDTLYQELPPDAIENMVIAMAGEFGRQLRSNGANGTDHGEGNVILVIGNNVQGGVYGEMFPAVELERLGDRSPQIAGLTEIDHIFGAISDWLVPGSGDLVFPRRGTAIIEQGVNFGGLFV